MGQITWNVTTQLLTTIWKKNQTKTKKNLAYVLYFTLDIEITSLNMFVLWVMDG